MSILEKAKAFLNQKVIEKGYFETARSWRNDLQASTETSRNRWRMGVLMMTGFCVLLIVWVSFLIPAQKLQAFLVHHYEDGVVTVEPMKNPTHVENWMETQSNLVKYVVNRESYSASDYPVLFKQVTALSSAAVSADYLKEQSPENQQSVVNQLGKKGIRRVRVETVLSIDSENKNRPKAHIKNHKNLAQIMFSVKTVTSSGEYTTPYTALIAWDYESPSKNPAERWQNWDGFNVTSYTLQQRNI